MSEQPNRQPRGVPTGGQFATAARGEAVEVSLDIGRIAPPRYPGEQEWEDETNALIGELGDREHLTVAATDGSDVTIRCRRGPSYNDDGEMVPGTKRGEYIVEGPGGSRFQAPYDNLQGTETAACEAAAGMASRMAFASEMEAAREQSYDAGASDDVDWCDDCEAYEGHSRGECLGCADRRIDRAAAKPPSAPPPGPPYVNEHGIDMTPGHTPTGGRL